MRMTSRNQVVVSRITLQFEGLEVVLGEIWVFRGRLGGMMAEERFKAA